MVNLEKWEKVEYTDLKVGDKIRRINKHDDGTEADIKGTIKSESFGVFQSKNNFALVRPTYAYPTELYRRKPKAFVFRAGKGAVVAGQGRGGTVELVHLGSGRWFSLVNTGTYGEQLLAATLSNFRVLSDGVIA